MLVCDKKILIFFIFLLSLTAKINAQKIDFQRDIQPIIVKHCTPCHQQGGAAPFSLNSYAEVAKRKEFIKIVTETLYMPPFYADLSFQRYHNERGLSEQEIQIIANWANQKNDAFPKGKEKDFFTKVKLDSLRASNNVIEIPFNKPYLIPDNNTEQFRIFVLPTNTPKPTYIKGIDFIPGHKPLAHHNRIMIDTTRRLRPDDGIEVGATSEFSKQNIQLADQFWYGWVPGKSAIFYPKGFARILPANSDLVINMHYAPSSRNVEDMSRVLLYPADKEDTIKRIVQTLTFDEQWVVNEPFEIRPDTIIKFYMRSPIVPYDLSLLSVLPHMHLLGKNFKSYAITPDGDLIPLLNIKAWNFNWQMNYQFKKMLHIPAGSVIFAEAEYDNTAMNPKNPFRPTQRITYGWGTKNEMFNLIFEYVRYQNGDEEIQF